MKNRVSEREIVWMVHLASACGVLAYIPFGYIYPLILGPQIVDPLWERYALALFAAVGFLLPRFPQTRPWMQAFVYLVCFVFTGHLFFLVCRNDLNMAYQMGYICIIAVIAFYLDTNRIFSLYAIFNALLLLCSLFFKVSYENLFFAMIIWTVLGIEWIALISRIRIIQSLHESRAAVQDRNRKIQSILENIQQGVLTIETPQGHIGTDSSAYLDHLVQDASGRPVRNLRDILERCQLSQDQIEQIHAAVFCIIGEDELAFALNYHLFPRSLVGGEGECTRMLELDWNPIRDQNNRVTQLLVCIRDVTELHKLRADAAEGQKELSLLAELVNVPRDRRLQVLDASRNLLSHLEQGHDITNVQALRLLHNLKGNARSFGLLTLAQATHDCESALQEGRKWEADLLEPLGALIEHYRSIAEQKLGHGSRSVDEVWLSRSRLKQAVASLDDLAVEEKRAFQPLLELVRESLHMTLEQILSQHLKSLPQLAWDLGKAPPLVHIADPGIYLQKESSELLANICLHLLRNSLDHGIETAAEREKAGKAAAGHIALILRKKPGGVELLFQDDGRGLDLKGIQEKAVRLGLLPEDAKPTADAIAALIFHPGFSTRDHASQISGRGVGLDLVRSMLEEAGGHIELILDHENGAQHAAFSLLLFIPAHHLAQWTALSA